MNEHTGMRFEAVEDEYREFMQSSDYHRLPRKCEKEMGCRGRSAPTLLLDPKRSSYSRQGKRVRLAAAEDRVLAKQ